METPEELDSPFRRAFGDAYAVRRVLPQDVVLLAVVVACPIVAVFGNDGKAVVAMAVAVILYNWCGREHGEGH